MSKHINDNPFRPWNNPMHEDDPFAPHNDPMREDDPFEPWNDPLGTEDDLSNEDKKRYDIRINEEE